MTKPLLVLLVTMTSLCASLIVGMVRRRANDSFHEAVSFSVITFLTCLGTLMPVVSYLVP